MQAGMVEEMVVGMVEEMVVGMVEEMVVGMVEERKADRAEEGDEVGVAVEGGAVAVTATMVDRGEAITRHKKGQWQARSTWSTRVKPLLNTIERDMKAGTRIFLEMIINNGRTVQANLIYFG